jgi:hypothetical protein
MKTARLSEFFLLPEYYHVNQGGFGGHLAQPPREHSFNSCTLDTAYNLPIFSRTPL